MMLNLFCIRPKGFNIGNEVIYQGMLAFVRRAFGGRANVISLPATSRYESCAKAGLTPRTVHEINQYGHGVIVGGGNLFENGELEMDPGAVEALDVPLMLFSLGAGRIYDRRHRLTRRTDAMPPDRIRALCRQARVVMVRDHCTADLVRRSGCPRVITAGCPSLHLADGSVWLPESPGTPPALLSIRAPELMNIPLADQARVRGDVRRIVGVIQDAGFGDVKLLCHDHRDLPFAASLGDVPYLYTDDVFVYLGWLRSCRVQVGYRLHAALPCLAMGTPTVSISYDERARSLLETVGVGDWDINMMRTPDVARCVADRLHRLEDLARIGRERAGMWAVLGGRMTAGFATFARAVRDTAAATGAIDDAPPDLAPGGDTGTSTGHVAAGDVGGDGGAVRRSVRAARRAVALSRGDLS